MTFGPSPGSGAVIYEVIGQTETTSSGDGYALPPRKHGSDEVVVQVDISVGSATVMIQARLSEEAEWKDAISTPITEATASGPAGLRTLSYAPLIRAVTSGVSGNPNIRVELYHG